jgi:hypothetical protein
MRLSPFRLPDFTAIARLIAFLVALAHPTFAQTQQPPPASDAFADAATEVAAKFTHLGARRVAVFDFVNPQSSRWDRLGQQLASDFRLRLDAAPHKFTQLSEVDTVKAMQHYSFEQDDAAIADVAAYALLGTKTDAFVTATIAPDAAHSALALSFFVYSASAGGTPSRIGATIPFTPELAALVPPPTPSESATLATAGKQGISTVACEYCPQALLTEAAIHALYGGTVYLTATVPAASQTSLSIRASPTD